ncbi:hypothetical protein [Streptomyces sp. NPDC002779]|uniref:hypothetical protein n=1 Tax=Streptomyces sp. NPDC002779 TaxID=3364664 RepID=UPI0036C8200C
MIHPDDEPGRRRCLDYAEFCERLATDNRFAAWFAELLADVDVIGADMAPAPNNACAHCNGSWRS